MRHVVGNLYRHFKIGAQRKAVISRLLRGGEQSEPVFAVQHGVNHAAVFKFFEQRIVFVALIFAAEQNHRFAPHTVYCLDGGVYVGALAVVYVRLSPALAHRLYSVAHALERTHRLRRDFEVDSERLCRRYCRKRVVYVVRALGLHIRDGKQPLAVAVNGAVFAPYPV